MPFGQRLQLLPFQLLKQAEVHAYSPAVRDSEVPFPQRASPFGLQSDADRQIGILFFPFEFQEEITRPFLNLRHLLLTQKIIFHLSGAASERIQPSRVRFAVQQGRQQTLHRHRFTRSVGATQQHFPVSELEILFVVVPEIDDSGSVHYPFIRFVHCCLPHLHQIPPQANRLAPAIYEGSPVDTFLYCAQMSGGS